jgi:hypothetical protein
MKTIFVIAGLLALPSPLPAQQPEHSLEASLKANSTPNTFKVL